MRDRFDRGMRDVPDTPAPHEAIERQGRSRRKRRSAVAGSVASVLVAAGLVTAVSLVAGGDGGSSATASGTGQATVSAPTPEPVLATSAPAAPPVAGLGRVVLASGEFKGHTWELVRVREQTLYTPPGPPSGAGRDSTQMPARGEPVLGYCESVAVYLDGNLDNRGGGGCGVTPRWDVAVPGEPGFFSAVVVGDTGLYKPGVGKLGTLTVGLVAADVSKVTATFEDDGTTIEAAFHETPTGDRYYVFAVPDNAGHGAAATVVVYGADGKPQRTIPNAAVGSGK